MQHPRPIGPTAVNVDAPFSVEMAQGYVPSRSPIRAAWMPTRVGWTSAQTTHVAAPFAPSMAQGVTVDRGREFLPLKTGLVANPTTTMHTAAAFSVEMSAGSMPVSGRAWLPLRTGLLAQTPDVVTFAIESIFATRPERPSLLLGARIPVPESQPTHVPTPFSPEMAAGWHSDRNREWLPLRTGLVVNPTVTTHTAAPFSIEMHAGAVSGRSRDWLPLRTGVIAQTPHVVIFDLASLYAMRPEQPRLLLGARIPLPVSQTTHDAAPFSWAMVYGSQPDRSRQRPIGPTATYPTFAPRADVLPFNPIWALNSNKVIGFESDPK